METYSTLREFADSWFLIAMFGFFVSAVLWAFRPGSTKTYEEVSQIPLRDDQPTSRSACANCKNGDACTSLKGASHV